MLGFVSWLDASFFLTRACSSSGRARHSHCRGKGFESPQVHQEKSRPLDGSFLVFLREAKKPFGFVRAPGAERPPKAAGSGQEASREARCPSGPPTKNKRSDQPNFLIWNAWCGTASIIVKDRAEFHFTKRQLALYLSREHKS